VIGNDIVDLHFLDWPSYQHIGHARRVCTTEELGYIREVEDPSIALAALWAVKEATYKLFSREAHFPFIPKLFAARFANPVRLAAAETAIVSYRGVPTRVELTVTDEWVHAAAISPAVQVVRWKACKIDWSPGKGRQLAPSNESEAVRSLAAELASRYCQEEVEQGFQGRVPILKYKDSSSAEIELSFSHHGRFAAVAMAWPIGDHREIPPHRGIGGKTSSWEETCSTCTA